MGLGGAGRGRGGMQMPDMSQLANLQATMAGRGMPPGMGGRGKTIMKVRKK